MSLNRIVLICRHHADPHEELPADAALSPGNALKVNSTNECLKVATEGDWWNGMVAKEDVLRGKTVADAFAAADIVPIHMAAPGDVLQMRFLAGGNYARGALLILDSAGRVKLLSAVTSGVTVKKVIGEVWEALNLSASGAVDTLGKVLIH